MLKNKLFAGAIFAVTLMFAGSVSAFTFDTTIDTLQEKKDVQTVLNMNGANLSVDGVFGPATMSAVKTFQTMKGLTPDGIIGAMTRAALTAASATAQGGTTSTVAGCSAGALFSATTGAPCTTVTTTVAGCTAGALFSSTTGASCTTGTVVVAGLTGAEGAIEISDFTSGLETTLGEGKTEKVLGVKITTDEGSDVAINTMKLEISDATGAGSTRIERYFDSAEIYMGTTKVGSVDVEDMSKNGTVYTKSVALTGAIVKKDSDAKFYVQLTANSSIDTDDQLNTWDIDVTSIRFTDAMGVVSTEPVSTTEVETATVDFTDSTENDLISIVSSSANPESANLEVKDNGTSEDYLVLAFKLKADSDSSDLNVLEIPVYVDTDATEGVEGIINDIYIKVGSTTYDNSDLDVANDTYVFTIDEGDFTIDSGETVEVKVYASFNKEGLSTTYDSGVTATFSVEDMTVENVDGDSVDAPTTDAVGREHTLLSAGAAVKYVADGSYSAYDPDLDYGTIALKFSVSAFGDQDVEINESGADVLYTLSGMGAATTESKVVSSSQVTAVGTSPNKTFTVSAGDTKEFTLTVKFSSVNAPTGFVKLALTSVDGESVTNIETASH